MITEKVIIVEGRQDKLQLLPIFAEPIEIVCTNGTFSQSRLEELLQPYEYCEVYAFFDSDRAGQQLRKVFKRHFPESNHLYTQSVYGEVERTPRRYLAKVLQDAEFAVKEGYLLGKG
ncbi:toprim domain-containing protein [Kurthia sibirica]|uniref:Toprim domain-containing protein n=1 Tax=Kurthia sibirica TaxID=202750 RepID=A0A2U3AIT1_9BACL|nr:toprim domain-containing protein [Kurthia sibirica]PWI24394.1 hypothetical protein DEX24_13740 [Kurthia sibirica]GEK33811.1 hypothetical protein KSI01_13440 [Kurthia sibirica]